MDLNIIYQEHPNLVMYISILLPLLLYIYGVWCGAKEKLVVYRNYNDIMLVGLLVIIPIIAISVIYNTSEAKQFHGTVLYVALTLEALFILIITGRTWNDNSGILSTALAIYVKLPTGILFFFHLYNIFSGDKRSSRRSSAFWTLMMLPLLYALVKDKKTGFIPKSGMKR